MLRHGAVAAPQITAYLARTGMSVSVHGDPSPASAGKHDASMANDDDQNS
jgi:hypothetical protein